MTPGEVKLENTLEIEGSKWPWVLLSCVLLVASCAVMVTAWYLHLKYEHWGYVKAIGISWLIAFLEYCLQVPANRIGVTKGGMSAA